MSQKIAIVTDSNSGITQQQAKELGIFVLPMPFLINEQVFFEDIDFSQAEFYERLQNDDMISTSQPAIGDILDLWDHILETHDAIVHIPMSSGLSGSCATATALAQDYEGRVQVVDNQRISATMRQSVMDALQLIDAGKSPSEIKRILEEVKFESSIYIMLDTLKYLKKGGRITPAAAAIATILRIKPVLQIQGEKLDAFAKARNEKLAHQIMMEALQKDIETRFGGMEQVRVYVAHTNKEAAAQAFANMIQQKLGIPVTFCDPLSLSIACHTGPGALGIACSKKIDRYL